MSTGRFRLQRADPEVPTEPFSPRVDASPAFEFISFCAHADPAPRPPRIGSLEYDLQESKYTHKWDSWPDFQAWLAQEQREKGIELRRVKTYCGTLAYDQRYRFVCSRKGTGGIKTYTKLRPDWTRKRESKRTDCQCVLIVKQYPGVSTILADYTEAHNHSLGNKNLLFTQISKETREYIAGLLRLRCHQTSSYGHSIGYPT